MIAKLTTDSLPFYVNKAMTAVLSFVWISLLIKRIGLDNYGLYVIILSLSSLFVNLLDFRTNEAVVYFLERKSKLSVLLLSFALDIVMLFIFVAVAYLLAFPIHSFYIKGSVPFNTLVWGLICCAPIFGCSTYNGFLQYKENFVRLNYIQILPLFVKVFFVLYFAQITLHQSIIVNLFANMIMMLIAISMLLGEIISSFSIENIKEINRKYVLSFLNYSIKGFISTTFKVGHANVSKIFLGYLVSPALVGIYEILTKVSMMAVFFSEPIAKVLYPTYAKSLKENRRIDKRTFWRITIFSFTLTCFSSLLIYSVKWKMLALLNVDYKLVSFNISLLLLSFLVHKVLFSLGWWTRIFPLSIGRPEVPMYANMIQFLLAPILSVLLIPYFSLYGAVAVKYIEFFVGIIFITYMTRKYYYQGRAETVK